MCGICGVYRFKNPRATVDPGTIERMTQSIVHRGPDDQGTFFDGALGFGFRRLSIIDLSLGHQPMSDEAGTVWVIFNGEIYNFKELRELLIKEGCVFKTNSDTETLIHGYKVWKDDLLNKLNGMFGFAIWDTIQKRLLIARDPSGIKFVYYRIHSDSIWFGSEIRPIVAAMGRTPDVNIDAIRLFMQYRYTPAPFTAFEGICKLPAGYCIVCENESIAIRRYVPPVQKINRSISFPEAVDELESIYHRALKRQLISDVPVGLFLSGGVDSGLLLSLMNETKSGWPTFTVGYGTNEYAGDELELASETAMHYNAVHTNLRISFDDFKTTLNSIVGLIEEPIASASVVPMYFISKRARQDVKVVLIGQGPDELFGGYLRHIGIRYGMLWRTLPAPVRSLFKNTITRIPRNETLKRSLYSIDVMKRGARYEQVLSIVSPSTIKALFRERHFGILEEVTFMGSCMKDLLREIGDLDELGGFQHIELNSTLPDELLMYADKLTMANSLEGRVPYLDREIVSFVQTLPAWMKIRLMNRKHIHKKVCARFLPASFIKRKKQGFAVNVVDAWFRDCFKGNLITQLSNKDAACYEFLDFNAVKALIDSHASGKENFHKLIFSIVMFQEWLEFHYRR